MAATSQTNRATPSGGQLENCRAWGANRGHTEKTSILEWNRHGPNNYKGKKP
jgi:hypothetical protein